MWKNTERKSHSYSFCPKLTYVNIFILSFSHQNCIQQNQTITPHFTVPNGIRPHHFMGNRWRNIYFIFLTDFIFWGSKITADGDCSREIKKTLTPRKKSYDQPRQHIKKQRHYFANKGLSSQGSGFSTGQVWM